MEDHSGVKFQQAMVALSRLWIGPVNPDDKAQPTTVSVIVPQDQPQDSSKSDNSKNSVKAETFDLPLTEADAKYIIDKFEKGVEGLRSDEDVSDNVAQHMLKDQTSLLDEKWLGTEEEERNCYVSELLYIHTKLMIVDDRRVIVSSRSFYGSNDAQRDITDGFGEFERP